jgi:hypothetical protein
MDQGSRLFNSGHNQQRKPDLLFLLVTLLALGLGITLTLQVRAIAATPQTNTAQAEEIKPIPAIRRAE